MYRETRSSEAMGYMATKPTMIVTTRHASGVVNAGVFGAYTNLSPSQVGIAIGTGSHTYANILRSKQFVINIPGADLVKSISTIASSIPETKSEVDEAGLTVKSGITFETPSIAECQAAVEFSFEKEVPIGYHSFLIGKVQGGWIREDVIDDDGKINIFRARVITDFKYPQPVYVTPGDVVEG